MTKIKKKNNSTTQKRIISIKYYVSKLTISRKSELWADKIQASLFFETPQVIWLNLKVKLHIQFEPLGAYSALCFKVLLREQGWKISLKNEHGQFRLSLMIVLPNFYIRDPLMNYEKILSPKIYWIWISLHCQILNST